MLKTVHNFLHLLDFLFLVRFGGVLWSEEISSSFVHSLNERLTLND